MKINCSSVGILLIESVLISLIDISADKKQQRLQVNLSGILLTLLSLSFLSFLFLVSYFGLEKNRPNLDIINRWLFDSIEGRIGWMLTVFIYCLVLLRWRCWRKDSNEMENKKIVSNSYCGLRADGASTTVRCDGATTCPVHLTRSLVVDCADRAMSRC